jgi:hypothetical protein
MPPCWISTRAIRSEIGKSTHSVMRVRSTHALPMPVALWRARPRISAITTTMPVAAEKKFWTARPSICTRYDIVDSPP